MVDEEINPDLYIKDLFEKTRMRNDVIRGRLFSTKMIHDELLVANEIANEEMHNR